MINCLANIMKQPCPFCKFLWKTQFSCHYPAEKCHFKGVDINILGITCSEFKPSYQLYQFRMQTMDSCIKYSLFTRFFNSLLNLLFNLIYNLFYPCWMYPAVSYQSF